MKSVFIGGMGHSGTTLLLKLLSLHSQIRSPFGTNENSLELITNSKKFRQKFKNSSRRILLKNPSNILYIKKIRKAFKDVKIILMHREGKDVSLSLYKRKLFKNFKECVKYWKKRMRLIQHYQKDKDVLIISYDELVESCTQTVNKICVFLEIELENLEEIYNNNINQEMRKPKSEVGKNHNRYRKWQINQPIQKSTYWETQMSKKQLKIYNKISGPKQSPPEED